MEVFFVNQISTMLESAAARTIISLAILGICIYGFRGIRKYLKKILNRLVYLEAFVYASDKASEHALKNGYGNKRDEELKKKLAQIDFIES